MLVTSDGQWVLQDSAEFLAALNDPNPDYDAAAFAVKNLGFIKFQMLGDAVIEVELHPRNVELPALLAVQQQILSSSGQIVSDQIFRHFVALRDYSLGRGSGVAAIGIVHAGIRPPA